MPFSEYAKDILKELINTGVGRAAVSLSELLNCEIILSVAEIKILALSGLEEYLLKFHSEKFVVVSQLIKGKLSGQGLVSFPVVKGKTLVTLLLNEPDSSEESFDVLELEAISEVGNLIINAVNGTISDITEIESMCDLPKIKISDHIIETLDLKDKNNIYLIGHTNFSLKERNIDGNILFVYAYNNIEIILKHFL